MNKNNRNKKINTTVNASFIGIIVVFLAAGLVKTVFFPKEKNNYENRKAEKIEKLSADSYMDGSFQDSVEASLADNVPLAETMKSEYNRVNSTFINESVETVMETVTDEKEQLNYINMGGINLYGDYLVFDTAKIEWRSDLLKKRSLAYNAIAEKYSDVDFYAYYIETDTEINFNTGEKVGSYECIKENLNFPEENIARFEIASFEDYKNSYYKTDHHWNADGSYRGYTEVLKLVAPKETPIPVKEKVQVAGTYSGSKTQYGSTASRSEEFYVNRFDFPEMTITINGSKNADYGQQMYYLKNYTEKAAYSSYYGGDFGEIIFDMNASEKENILLIGESYDNAILKLLSTHFNKTHSIDLRYYQNYMGKAFDFGKYIEENEIDKVLFIGAIDYYITDTFLPEK